MLYAIICYNSEAAVSSWTKEQDAAVIARHREVLEGLGAQGRLGPVARLHDTKTAVSARSRDGAIVDGPFAETKEQLLGFYVVDCASLEEATELAKQLVEPPGCMEVRPVHTYWPPSLAT
ncbi:MAG TPA: YciI family protein [Povalibacter sp.]